MPRLGRYSIVRKLATGGMAEVYLARVAGPGGFEKHVVLKSILPQLSDDDLYVKMFLEEAKVAAQLDHPNIVHVFDFGEIDGTYFLTMEYVEGATLRQVARWAIRSNHEPIAPTLAARIISQACDGLSYAHSFTPPEGSEVKRLIHRDVSPENIMLARNGSVKLLDFGVAKTLSEDHRSSVGMVKGKVAFMPPEQLQSGDIDHRVDIYALGVCLYMVLSGRRPYEGNNDVALIQRVLEEEPTPLLKHRLDLPDNLLDIVAKAIAKKADDRFQTCDELRDALDAYIASEGQVQGTAQISKLVQRYLAEQKALGPSKQPGSKPGIDSEPSSSAVEAARVTPAPRPSRPLSHTMTQASRSTPGVKGPFAASSRSDPPSEDALEQELLSEEPKTDPGSPPIIPDVTLPRPALSSPRPRRASSIAIPVQPMPPPPSASGSKVLSGPIRTWTPHPVGVEPIRQALRDNLRADRSATVLRKLPAVIARLCDVAPQTPWALHEVLAGVLDAAVLSDDHGAVGAVLELASRHPGKDDRFARLVDEELASPLRLGWLVERLRSGLPTDLGGLRSWLLRLSAGAAPLLVTALEASEHWPEQELFASALASATLREPSVVLKALAAPSLATAAGFCFALEKSGIEGRDDVFARVLQGADVKLECEVLAGRARARGEGSIELLLGYLDHKKPELRRRALELCGQLTGERGFITLWKRVDSPAFEERPAVERELAWAALLEAGGESGFSVAWQVLTAKPSLLKKRKDDERKLTVIEGLKRLKTEQAGALLEAVLKDPNQSPAVVAEARQVLKAAAAAMTEPEGRTRLVARVSLELALLARASTTVDVGSGVLDGAIERFREGVRQVQLRDGWLNLEVSDGAPSVNDGPVSLGAFHAAATVQWERALRARELKGFSVAGPVTVAELRSFLFRAFDPDGKTESLRNITAFTFSGRLTRQLQISASADPTARAKELYASVLAWLERQRDALKGGAAPDMLAADAELDEWAALVADGQTRFLGVERWAKSDRGRLEHAVNTAAVAMAFARDLGVPRSYLRELAELSVVLGLAEAVEESSSKGQDHVHAAALMLTHRLNRLGTVVAVAAYEAGAPDRRGGVGSVIASVYTLAKAYDERIGSGAKPSDALQAMNSEHSSRFSPELLGLFTQWAFAQGRSGDR